jgi:glutamine---fructose-6-phosphate transaminase (isomerizing)
MIVPISSRPAAPFQHWMLQEIYEQPETLQATLDHYVALETPETFTAAAAPIRTWIESMHDGLLIAASGSSRHASMVAELEIEELADIAVDVEYASEYSYRSEEGLADAAVMVVSQSGETADTLAALRKARLAGHTTLAITNVDNSTMAQEATVSFPTFAGRERAIPATKSFTAQLLNLYLFALLAARTHDRISEQELQLRLMELKELPAKISSQLPLWETAVRRIADQYQSAKNFLFLGRGIHYPIAREGALKLKESAYLHAEGYPSGELKHGPNALVAEGTPLVMLATREANNAESEQRYQKVMQLMRDMREQEADILAVANRGDDEAAALATHCIFVRETREELLTISEIIPLQMFAYFMAIQRGIDVDSPRNLTKAVLAE